MTNVLNFATLIKWIKLSLKSSCGVKGRGLVAHMIQSPLFVMQPMAASADRKGHHQSPKSSQKLSTEPEVQPEVDPKSVPTASEIAIKLYHSVQVIRDLSNCITLLQSKFIKSQDSNQTYTGAESRAPKSEIKSTTKIGKFNN